MVHKEEPGRVAREIDVFCPSHGLSFTVRAASHIACGRNGHELDNAFPRGAFWEYCCDCQTFVLCEIVKERKADDVCPSCTRQFSRRYVCGRCHVMTCESDTAARRKQYSFKESGDPPPVCPGCLESTAAALAHGCEDFGVAFITPRRECPFCHGSVEPAAKPQAPVSDEPKSPPPADAPRCPSCKAPIKPHFKFCKKCRTPLHPTPGAPGVGGAGGGEHPAAARTPSGAAQDMTVKDLPPVLAPTHERASDEPSGRELPINMKVVAVVAGMIVLLGALLVGASYRTTSAPSTETQLASAIARGNLISPPGESAQFYYNRLKSEGAGADTLKRYASQLVPALKARPYKMLEDFALPGSSDPSPFEWEEAGRLLTWAAELAPDDKPIAAKAAYCTGRASYVRQQTDAALELWGRSNQLDSTWPLPPNGVGLIYNERRQYATARPYLLEAIRRDPKWAVPYNNMGTSYFYEKNYDEAAGYYEKAASLAPQWARPHAWLGDIAYERKDFCTARQEYQSALDLATPGMSSWNPQRIESKRDSAAAKCTQSQYAPRRIEFGVGGTTASLRGSTSGTDAYVISAGAGQTMTISLTTEGAGATVRVLDAGMNHLGEGAWWQGTLPHRGDYNIQVTAAGGTSTYTLRITIPPLG